MRIGFGWDIHKIEPGGKLIIGGVVVSHDFHAVAHSDGDVLSHATIDALLGGAGFGDIGEIFPESEETRNMSSINALKKVAELIRRRGFKILNIDSTVVFSGMKLSKFREDMEKMMEEALGCRFSVKFKTGNGIGDVGEGKAIEAFAVALMVKNFEE